jgi:hypothetical protein
LKSLEQQFKFYAGIGSRQTPTDIQNKMTEIARRLDSMGYYLRSGGAQGADTAFEIGATKKQIFLPWDGFNGRKENGKDYIVPPYNEALVELFHPKPLSLSEAGRKLMSRNSYQVLGPTLENPVDFVLCWTKDGKASGGTGQAIRIAEHFKIPVFNLKNGFDEFSSFLIMNEFFS